MGEWYEVELVGRYAVLRRWYRKRKRAVRAAGRWAAQYLRVRIIRVSSRGREEVDG